MKNYDHEFLRRILDILVKHYPGQVLTHSLAQDVTVVASHLRQYLNLLDSNEVIKMDWRGLGGMLLTQDMLPHSVVMTAKGHSFITSARGRYFLDNAGDLYDAINIVTIAITPDDVRRLLDEKLQQSSLSVAEKQQWRQKLQNIPAQALTHLVIKLLDAGLEKWDKLLPALQKMLN